MSTLHRYTQRNFPRSRTFRRQPLYDVLEKKGRNGRARGEVLDGLVLLREQLKELDNERAKNAVKSGIKYLLFGQCMAFIHYFTELKGGAGMFSQYLTDGSTFLAWFSTWCGLERIVEHRQILYTWVKKKWQMLSCFRQGPRKNV